MMIESTFTLNIDKGKEYDIATILDVIGNVTGFDKEKNQLIVTIDCSNEDERLLIKDLLGHFDHVSKVKEQINQ